MRCGIALMCIKLPGCCFLDPRLISFIPMLIKLHLLNNYELIYKKQPSR